MPSDLTSQRRPGIAYGLGAYFLWGLLPIYLQLLAPAGAFEIVAWRVLWSIVLCAGLLTVTRTWGSFFAVWRTPRLFGLLAAAAAIVFVNWQVYVYASTTGKVTEAAMGYFINPLVTIVLGVVFLGERLRRLQWLAVSIGLVAVAVLVVAYGQFPWIALSLAFSFGFYGLLKSKVGASVDAVSGLLVETVWLAPVAAGVLGLIAAFGGGVTFGTAGVWHAVLLMLAGPVTAVPLLLFAASARRIPLVWTGLIQYLTPIMQLLVGVLLLHEPMSAARWTGFALVWVALVFITTDAATASRKVTT